MSKKLELAEEKVFLARMVSDFNLYTAKEVLEKGLQSEEFVTPDKEFALKYVAPYDRKGRRDRFSDGADKPRVHVSAFFRKTISLHDHRELFGIDKSLTATEHRMHNRDSEWHDDWKDRVRDFCELEKRFYPNGEPTKSGYKIADAYYSKANTVIEFQKAFDDSALLKTEFYKKEKIRLIWLFYLPTLGVFKDENIFKIREDNFYHFFRIEDNMPKFYEENVVFLQDKYDKIYLVKKLHRIESNSELEATVRYFDISMTFSSPDDFVLWFRDEWIKSIYCRDDTSKTELKSIEEILKPFDNQPDKMFFLQNCKKKDKNGNILVYCFIKDNGIIREDTFGYLGYRCFEKVDGYYLVNKQWNSTTHNPKTKKWHLLATNNRKYSDEVDVK